MQISEIKLAIRERVEPLLIYSPFLRLIIFNVWFQLGFAAVVLTIIAAILYMPKMWRVSPPEFEPVVKVSGLDMTQNWALKRSAQNLEASGKYEQAAEAWERAVHQNPADESALQGFLQALLKIERPNSRITFSSVNLSQWLLRLSRTNVADVDLVARVCDHVGFQDLAAYLFEPHSHLRSSTVQAVLIKHLFHQNRIPEFVERMDESGSLPDPELKYYRLAHEAGWKDEPESSRAFSELVRVAASPEGNERIGHLLLRAAAQKQKVELFSQELDRLARRGEAKAGDYAVYWTLLAAAGRTNEAHRLAESATLKPASAAEAIRVSQSYIALGMVDQARELMKQMAPQYARTPEMWMAYVGVLQMKEDWDGIRTVARMIRQDVGVRETLWGYSYFLEGRADLEQMRRANAELGFEQAAASAYEYGVVGLWVARELTQLSYPRHALRVFHAVESAYEKHGGFWDSYYKAALGAQDADELLKATERSHRLNPKDLARLNNYAAALLVAQKRPEEAIELTLQLYSRFPQSNAALINHACALLLNHRAQEALTLLGKVDVQTLGPAERSQYFLTIFETCHSLALWEQARKAREAILESALFPVQRERLREKDKQLANAVSTS
jgi:tetratricopeptide (TPR) repeat protein